MADLNALIAQGAQFRQPVDPFMQYAQMQQLQQGEQANQLGQLKMQEYQRGLQEQEGVRNYLKSTPNFDPANPVHQSGLMQVAPATAPKLLESFLTAKKTAVDIGKTTMETATGDYALKIKKAEKAIDDIGSLNTAEEAAASIDRHIANGDLDPQKGAILKTKLAEKPFKAWQQEMLLGILGAKDQLEATASKPVEKTNGQIKWMEEGNPRLPNFGQSIGAAPIQLRATPDVQLTAETTRRGQNITAGTAATQGAANRANAMEIATLPTFNEAAGGFTGRPTAANPSGSFTPLPAVALNKDVAASAKVLKAIGYDPAAKTDKVSELIKQSTSGGLQAATTGGLGMVGISTSGAKAIGSLEALASSLNLDMLGGRLGAGISDADTAMIRQGLADIANPRIPAPTRLAAWNTVVEKLSQRTEGGTISSLGSGTAAPAGTSVTTPDGQVHTFPSAQAAAAFKKAVGQ